MRFLGYRNTGHTLGPEFVERRVFGGATGFVSDLDVVHLRLAFGEGIFDAAERGQAAEYLKVVQRVMLRRDDLFHRIDLVDAVRAGGADVIAFHRGSSSQHDVGPPRRAVPPRLMADDGVHILDRARQLVKVLLVRERIVARVVDQLDRGEGVRAAVVGEFFAGVEQHLANT